MRITHKILIFLSSLSSIPNAYAWSEESHMTIGAIAYDNLAAQDPALLTVINRIIADHPNYKELSAHADRRKEENRLRTMMQWMARWPDDIRGTSFSHPEWHTELRVVYGRTWFWPFRNENALEGLDSNYRIFADDKASDRDRAIALSWLLHIIGDIQQPLHAGHQMTSEFPATDRAGQLAHIRKASDDSITNLHQYWDKILDEKGNVYSTSDKWASALQNKWSYGVKTMVTYRGSAQNQFSKWLDESAHLAKIIAYKGTYLRASVDAAKAPRITEREQRIAVELSKRRIVIGGYRSADIIKLALD